MEDLFTSFPLLLSFILLSVILLVVNRFTITTSNFPPGPWRLPIFGNIHQLIGSLPHHRLRELAQKYGPLMHLKLGEVSTIVVSSADVAKEVLKTHDIIFAQRPHFVGGEKVTYGYIDIVLSPYGDYWKHLRKLCTLELLSAKRVRSFQSIREGEVSNLIREFSLNTGSSINLSEKIFSMTYAITARAAFGEKCKDQEAFISIVKEIMKLSGGFSVADLFPSQKWLHLIGGFSKKHEEIHQKSDRIFENIISGAVTKTAEGEAEGLLSFLLNLKHHGDLEFPLTIDNIKAVILDVFIGGSETSSTVLDWAIAEMLKNPRVMERAQAEVRQAFGSRGFIDETTLQQLEYLKAVVKETMRLHPPAPLLIPRKSSESCEIKGYKIPGGAQVFVNAWAIGRDPNYWSEAEKFCPERFLNCSIDYKGSHFEFIPFGAGKRICPGILFGVANTEFPLAKFLYHFDWALPLGTSHENLDMTEAFGTTVRRTKDLFIIPIPYNHVPVE